MRAADPNSKASQIIAILKEKPGEEQSVADITKAMGLDPDSYPDRNGIAQRLAVGIKKAGRNSEWRHVHRVRHGFYTFSPEITEELERPGWEPIVEENGVYVLRSPEGRLYSARPIGKGSDE